MSASRLARGLVLLLALLAPGWVARADDPRGEAPLTTTTDRAAERAARDALDALRGGDLALANEKLHGFLLRFGRDPLAPRMRVELARLHIVRFDPSAPEDADTGPAILTEAESLLAEAARQGDTAVAERARFYGGIVRFFRGDPRAALEVIRPLEGRLVEPEDAALLLETVAAACLSLGERVCAVESLDRRIRRASDAEGGAVAMDLATIVGTELTSEDVQTLADSLPHDGPAWPLVARRALREAFAAGDLRRAAALAAALRIARVPLEGDLNALAMRAERNAEPDPRVIGAILPMTGPLAARGRAQLRGMAIGVGTPPARPFEADDFRIELRDHAGRPARAARAVDDLVSLHRVIAIVGPPDAASATAAARRANELGVPFLSIAPLPPVVADLPYVFRLVRDPASELEALLSAAHEAGARRIALLGPADVESADLRAVARALAEAHGVEVVAEGPYGDDAAPVVATAPDAVLLLGAPAEAARWLASATPTVARRRPRAPAFAPTLLLPSTSSFAAWHRALGARLEGALVIGDAPHQLGEATRIFEEAFVARNATQPDSVAAAAYDAVRFVLTVVRGRAATREAVRDTLASTSSFGTAGPHGGFTTARGPTRPVSVRTVRDGVPTP